MRRIMIVGHPGSGKSTLARRLGATLGLPVHHVDQLFWLSPGNQRSGAEAAAAIAEVVSQDSYILEGGHGQTYADRLTGCDTVIWLDPGLPVCLFRVWRRAWLDRWRGQAGIDTTGRLPGGPSLRRMLAKYPDWHQELVGLTAKAPPGVRIIRLRSAREVRRFVAALSAASG